MIRLARIQHALIALLDFLDPQWRWIPKDHREMFDVGKHLERLREAKLIKPEAYAALLGQAREAGLAVEKAAPQADPRPE